MPPGAKTPEQLSNRTVDSNRSPDIRTVAGRWWKGKQWRTHCRKINEGNVLTSVNSLTLNQRSKVTSR